MSCRRSAMILAAGAGLLVAPAAVAQQPAQPPAPAAAPAEGSEASESSEAATPAEPSPEPFPAAPASGEPEPEPAPVRSPEPAPAPEAAAPVVPAEQAMLPAPAQAAPVEQPDSLGSYQRHVQLMVGVRTSYLTDDNYRLFSRTVTRAGENFPVVQLSLGGGVTLLSQQQLSLAVIGLWDYGGSSSELRGEQADIDIHRLALGAELRHHFIPWVYALVRAAPVAVNARAGLDDSAAGQTLYSRSWSFGFDLSAGAALQLYGKRSSTSRTARVWLIAEGGYGWANSTDLRFRPDKDDEMAPQRIDEVDLGTLAIRGPMFRISGALTL